MSSRLPLLSPCCSPSPDVIAPPGVQSHPANQQTRPQPTLNGLARRPGMHARLPRATAPHGPCASSMTPSHRTRGAPASASAAVHALSTIHSPARTLFFLCTSADQITPTRPAYRASSNRSLRTACKCNCISANTHPRSRAPRLPRCSHPLPPLPLRTPTLPCKVKNQKNLTALNSARPHEVLRSTPIIRSVGPYFLIARVDAYFPSALR